MPKNPSNVKMGKPHRATKADLVCAVPGCTDEPEFHMGAGGWTRVYWDGVPVFLKDNLKPLLTSNLNGKDVIESHNLWAFKYFKLRQEMPRGGKK